MAKPEAIVTGVDDIDRRLKTLEPRVQKKILATSMRRGMRLVLAAAKAAVPVRTGLTKANLKMKAGKRRRGRQAVNVQVASAEGLVKQTLSGERVFTPAVVEFGDSDTPAHPFMRPAFDVAGPPAREVTMTDLLLRTLLEAES